MTYVIERFMKAFSNAPVYSDIVGRHDTLADARLARQYMVQAAIDDDFTIEKGLPDSQVIVLVRTRVKIDFIHVECRCSSIVLCIQEIF